LTFSPSSSTISHSTPAHHKTRYVAHTQLTPWLVSTH
jgi:hypothetical protein